MLKLPIALVCALLALADIARAASTDSSIVAVVNDQAISSRDVRNRIALFLVTGNLGDTPEIRARLEPEVMTMLIDDALKRQEARRLNLVVGAEEIDRALTGIASQLGVPPEQLGPFLAARGVGLATLREQIETDIAWVKAVNRLAAASLTVSEEEVDEKLEETRKATGQPEFRVGEIFLPVDQPTDDAAVRDLATRLIAEIRAGASFSGIARIFSQGPATTTGGDLGWIRPGQLDPELERVLFGMQPGQIAGPIRSPSGYHILLLFSRRVAGMAAGNVVIDLFQVFVPLSPSVSQEQVAQRVAQVRELTEGARSCADLAERSRGQPGVLAAALGRTDLRAIPPQLQQVVAPLQAGDKTPVMRSVDGVALLMVCDRQDVAGDQEVRTGVRRFLREERLATASRRILRDLRRSAMVDVRR
jgi:peptidyl-prolyl cis-trans isomerase SurA